MNVLEGGLLALKDKLFIASNFEGILGYQLSQEKYFSLNISKKLLDKKIAYDVFHLNKRSVLFSLNNSFLIYNVITKETQVFNLPKKKKENFINAVISLDEENFLLGTSESGLLQINLKVFYELEVMKIFFI